MDGNDRNLVFYKKFIKNEITEGIFSKFYIQKISYNRVKSKTPK
jgi:hypothetical protein